MCLIVACVVIDLKGHFDLLLLSFRLDTVVLMPFLFRLGMAHFSASGDSIASLFIVVRIGLEPCNSYTLYAAFVRLPGPAICFCCKMLCFLSRLFVS